LATDQGTASYGVTIPAGTYNIGGRGGSYFPGTALVGQFIRDGALSEGEAAATEAYFVENGATASYGSVTDFANYWRGWSELTSFPLIDTSSGTGFYRAWSGCSSLTSFPLIDTSSGTGFYRAWSGCSSLTSFPLIDTSSGTDFAYAWHDCTSLTSFPLIDTSAGTNFFRAWQDCTSLTGFPLIDTSAGTNFDRAWYNCNSLTSFPQIDTSAGIDFFAAWLDCSSLTSFPLIDTSAGTRFYNAWRGCSSLTSFPQIDTSAGTNFFRAWQDCTSLTSFPLIDTSAGTDFFAAWQGCSSLTSFPLIDTSSGSDFSDAWKNCTSLTSFPANAFDNVKGGSFTDAFTGTALTQTSIDNILVSLVTSGRATGTRVFDQSGGSAPSSTGEAAIDTLRSRGWTVTVTGDYFSPAFLFAGGQKGLLLGAFDIDTLFQVSDGTTPVTVATNPIGYFGDKSGNDNHATQATAAARPIYQTAPDRVTIDGADDKMTVTVPVGGFTGTMVLATDQGTASYGVNIPAGAYDIGGRGGQYFPGNAIVGQLIRDGALSAQEAAAIEAYFVGNGATAGYGSVTNFSSFWRNWSEITSFPLIDTSAGTNFSRAWYNCNSLTSFPLIDTSAGTDFYRAWYNCNSLTSFPPIDTSAGTNFFQAWQNCTGLTSFPLIDTSSGTNFFQVWQNCTSLTSFPLIDMSAGNRFDAAWHSCTSLTSFPANIFDNVKGGNFTDAFNNTALTQTSIDNILVSLAASGIATGTRVFDQSGGSAPSSTGEAAIDTLRSRGWTVTVTGDY